MRLHSGHARGKRNAAPVGRALTTRAEDAPLRRHSPGHRARYFPGHFLVSALNSSSVTKS
jgi:hypothetical protein